MEKIALSSNKKFGLKSSKTDNFAKIVVFDIGGTNFRAAIYNPETNTLSNIIRELTPNYWNLPSCNAHEVMEQIQKKNQ